MRKRNPGWRCRKRGLRFHGYPAGWGRGWRLSNRRWEIALHEAGHVVAAEAVGRRLVGAVLLNDRSGRAWVGGEPCTVADAAVVAAGAAAERLADDHNPPDVSPAVGPMPEADDERGRELARSVIREPVATDAEPDEMVLARWACMNRPYHPGLWELRANLAHDRAADLVEANCDRVLEVARVLYATGVFISRKELNHDNDIE